MLPASQRQYYARPLTKLEAQSGSAPGRIPCEALWNSSIARVYPARSQCRLGGLSMHPITRRFGSAVRHKRFLAIVGDANSVIICFRFHGIA